MNRAGGRIAILLFGALLGALHGADARALELRGIQENNSGVSSYRDKKQNEAFDRFARSLGDLPFDPKVHYNLGRTYFEKKEYEKSFQESMTAAKLAEKDPATKFLALFQAASALALQKKVDEAIATYQEALEIVPDSKETKTNIELLVAGGQGGGGGNENQQPQQGDEKNQDGQDQGDQQKQPRSQDRQNPRATPRPFNSRELSKKDVENILDELRAQEEDIRAKFQREGAKDAPKEKDW